MAIKGILPSGEQMERIVVAIEKIADDLAGSVPRAIGKQQDMQEEGEDQHGN